MKGGRIAAEWLKAQGVTHVFALCGEHVLPLLDGCEDVGITVIGARHEQSAVLEAEAFARVTGRPGVACVTAGPGVTNAVTGLAVANTCGSPVMLLAGRTSTPKRLIGTFQDIDGTKVVAGVTKWADTCLETNRIPDYLEAAWRRMVGGRPGAVVLELPHDVLAGEAEAEVEVGPIRLPEPAGASPEALRAALAMLSEAEKPVIMAGSGAFWAGASDALRALAERARIPVTTLNAARGIIPDDDEVSLGPRVSGGAVLTQADVILIVGTRFDVGTTFGGPPLFTGNEKIIQIDVDATAIGLNRTPELGILGDARVVLQQMADAWDGKPKDAWLAQAKEIASQIIQGWMGATKGEGSPVPPGAIPAAVIETAPKDAILVSDGGDIHTWCVTTFPASAPGTLLTTHDALGTIGVGVPYAVGAKAAAPDRPVIMVIGDGSFGFGGMELETAARNNLPIVAIVANNGAWGNIRHEEGRQFRQTGVTQLSVASYEKIAEAFGGHAQRVDDSKDLAPAIKRALDAKVPAVINVIMQQGVVSPITDMMTGMAGLL